VTAKFAKLRFFENIPTLPCTYTHNKNAWMMTKIFVDFLCQFVALMDSSNRKVLFFMDKCPASPPDTTILKNIKVIFFLANRTSRLQLLGLGMIHVTKGKYQNTLFQKAVTAIKRKVELKLRVLQQF
jgi:hypothetical protein